LPNLTEKRAEVEKKLNEALASGRLDPAKLNDFKQDLNRIAFLESTFKSNDGQIDDREAVALSKEFDNLDKAMAATVQPLPDIDKLQADIKKKLLDARAAGKLSASNAATLESDFNRIDGIEKSFRSSNTNLSEWETMSLKRDLDRLSLDLDRLAVDTPKVEVDTSALAADTRGHWAEKYIAILQQQGTIGGFPDGSFKPDNGITRAQFAAIAAKALNIPEAGRDAKFADLSKKHWAYKAISAVNDAGLVGGYPDGSFRPEDKITRTQAFVILSKALNNAKADPDVLSRYKDGKSVAIWAVPSVAKAVNAGIVVNHPDPYAIRPDAQATRAEVAALTYQTMASLGQKLPAIRIGLEASGN
ncbi:MAG: S-layer homology domain-containing protein, partial [Candidatus Obscuribacterales bacterium]|nr:S-layer homology domain-containing protein [Candidatus Obscuribacterales bacterium]